MLDILVFDQKVIKEKLKEERKNTPRTKRYRRFSALCALLRKIYIFSLSDNRIIKYLH